MENGPETDAPSADAPRRAASSALRPWHALTTEATLDALRSGPDGLGEAEAAARLLRHGPNRLETTPPASAIRILIAQLESIVVLLLLVAAAVAFFIGDPLEAAAIAAVLLINVTIGFIIELRARRAMEGLLSLEVSRATVVRAGRPIDCDASDLVPGDVIALEAGQSVPADARLIAASDLRVDEAALTGESLPVDKSAAAVEAAAPLADRTSMLHKGTAVVAGAGRAAVVATGMATEVGRIGVLVGGLSEHRTPLEERLDRLGRRLVGLTLLVAAAVALAGVARGLDLVQVLETSLALAVSAIPEGLPVVATIALGVGLRRMARRHALIRRLPAVEALGSATIVCTDKTGTLTAGEMTVANIWADRTTWSVSGAGYEPRGEFTADAPDATPANTVLRQLLRAGALANRASIERGGDGWIAHGDPTEAALLVAALKAGIDRRTLVGEFPEAAAIPFSSERLLMATFHADADRGFFAAVKGAPGATLSRCDRMLTARGMVAIDDDLRAEIAARNEALAASGLRVLALASKQARSTSVEELSGLVFLGLAGMIDPPAAGVRQTIDKFRRAGIRTVMVTGDQKLTAAAVGRELGLLAPGQEILDTRELAGLTDRELIARGDAVAGFSRVSPEDKLRIVGAYRDAGHIVAMLGDGVNDAAALKKADIGVAMGRRGTDIARETADVILQDDRFPTVAAAIEEGRVIYDNIRKFVFYLFSCNLAEVLTLFVTGIAGLPLPLLPLQILWLNLVTDTFPALALALEPGDPGIMERPPVPPGSGVLSRSSLVRMAQYGVLITLCTLAAFLWGLATGPEPRAMTLAFMTLALAQIFYLGNARSRADVLAPRAALRNRWAVGAVVLSIALQILAVHLPALARILHTQPLAPVDWAVAVGLGAIPAVLGQLLKLRARGREPAGGLRGVGV